jgi:pyruvate-formate lyase-activating enzyme
MIDCYGKVFSCCFAAPWPFGSIYKNTLSEIWAKSLRLKIARWLSSRGALHCFANCFMRFSFSQEELAQHCKGRPVLPKKIMIACGDFCNYKCIMCNADTASKLRLDTEYVKKNIDWPKVEMVILTGGEILAIPSARELFLWLSREMNKKVDVLSNGSLITPEWAEYLVKGGGRLSISVNAATPETYKRICQGNFPRIIENLKKLVELKQKFKTPCEIRFGFTIIPENAHEIADAIVLANSLGCDVLGFSFATSGKEFLAQQEDLRRQLKVKITQVINDPKVAIAIEKNYLAELGLL